ncbi:hypothetical protein [Shewanella septentrionalis]|uniref:Uncharacterized protein n=1 Tax=Shewanella septentrionalis TaxID=2952223 RepID=A0A9X2WYF2_9GAMM|nr:hypothetical protein [Shewanella septentrionalis]MCT7947713.1 hypothetical protein [Shewanella septentrionalis]
MAKDAFAVDTGEDLKSPEILQVAPRTAEEVKALKIAREKKNRDLAKSFQNKALSMTSEELIDYIKGNRQFEQFAYSINTLRLTNIEIAHLSLYAKHIGVPIKNGKVSLKGSRTLTQFIVEQMMEKITNEVRDLL